MIKLCVFDLDGTLVDSLEDLAGSMNHALEKNGFQRHEVSEYRYLVGDGVAVLIQRAVGEEQYTEEIAQKLRKDFDECYQVHYADCTRPFDGMPYFVSNLAHQGIQCAVLSNKPDDFVKIIIEKMFPGISFVKVQGNTKLYPRKPDPAALLAILKELDIQERECLYVGDSNVDIFTAKNAGVKSVGVLWGFRDRLELEQAGADFIVGKPEEILKLIG